MIRSSAPGTPRLDRTPHSGMRHGLHGCSSAAMPAGRRSGRWLLRSARRHSQTWPGASRSHPLDGHGPPHIGRESGIELASCGSLVSVDDKTTAAWVLLSVASVDRERPAELWEVIGAADAINHALLMDSEIELGVNCLASAGLLDATDSSLALTPEGRALVERCSSRDSHAMWRRITDALPHTVLDGPLTWTLDPQESKRANSRYRSEIRNHERRRR